MFINDKKYDTNLLDINNIRYLLFTNLYSNESYIESLKNSISKFIDCLTIDYDSYNSTFTVKIKKTSMRRIHGFKFVHYPIFYYQLTPAIFQDFISTNKESVLAAISTSTNQNPNDVYEQLIRDRNIMTNLCHITCLSDNIIIIKL